MEMEKLLPARKAQSKPGSEEERRAADIGYALAASSCEGVGSVDACTVTALDAITSPK